MTEVSKILTASAGSNSIPPAIRPSRYWRSSVSLSLLALIALVAALYLARTFFVPLLIGILTSYTLSPIVEWLAARRIPRPLGAALVIAMLIGGLSWIMLSMSDDAAAMIERLPEVTRKLRQNLSEKQAGRSALQNMQEAAKQLEGVAADAGSKPGMRPVIARAGEPTAWLRNYLIEQSSLLIAVVAQAPIVLLLTYFLLASGKHFRRKLVQLAGPALSSKKDVVEILDEIEVQIQLYLLSMLVSGILVGVGIWLGFEALGMEQAAIWGVVAGVLQFVPYLGAAVIAISSAIACFLQFGSLPYALAAMAIALGMAFVVGLVFTTWMQSRFAQVNPTVLFIALLFFAWLWGAWGLLLGAPLVAIVKVICDRVESFNPLGDLLGR